MNLRTFTERPILSAVISIVIVLVGVIGLFSLPVEQFPSIAPPTISVSTTYYGANSETLQKSVIAPLEEAINGVENMTYMTSQATNTGMATITVYFKQGTDPDMAAVNVQNCVSSATSKLPQAVKNVGVTTKKRQSSMLQVFALSSPTDEYDENFISNYIDINIKPEVKRIYGVGDLTVLGGTYSMRIWMDPIKMAQHNLVPSDITGILSEQNIEAATGSIGENSNESFQYVMRYKGRKITAEEFGDMVIRSTTEGQVLRVKDVARIELGLNSYSFNGAVDGHPGIGVLVFQTAGSNATEVNNKIDKFLDQASAKLPKGLVLTKVNSTNDFLFASIHEVVKTLIEAILLVVLVVLVFLQSPRTTVIPLVGIIVSLVGTFAFMSVAGFSLNLITLFALVLVIGTVVDDAIIVVEAVQAKFDLGYNSSHMATNDAIKGVSSAVITSSLVFMAVFIPVSFMGGTSGVFYRQFGLTMAAAVGISAVQALTTTPALCALMLRPEKEEEKKGFWARFGHAFNAAFGKMQEKYRVGVQFFCQRKKIVVGIVALCCVALVMLMRSTKSSLVPTEDQGMLMMNITCAPGTSLNKTNEITNEVRARVQSIPGVQTVLTTAGYGLISGASSSAAMAIIKLKNWEERTDASQSAQAIIGQIYGRTADIKGASIFAMQPGMIPGYGMGNSVELNMQDRSGGDMTQFYNSTMQYVRALNQRPEVQMAYTTFALNFPQWEVDVDPAKCKRAGVSPATVLGVLGTYYGGSYVSDFNRFSKIYMVMLAAEPESRRDEASLNNMFVRMDNGQMAPLSEFVTLRRVYGAEVLSRFNMYNSISVNVAPNAGYSSGQVMQAISQVAQTNLPSSYGYEYGGMSREESEQSGQTVLVFGICFIMIYLLLAALYESFLMPLAVLMSVPAGLMGSFLFAKFAGLENNIYLQTGLIMLIGLLAKTAILLTEYATERRRSGMSLISAALSAAKDRLRPILMTVFCMVVGLLPLVFAHGVGANGNRSLGTGVVGGMLCGTLAILFLVPALFVLFQWLQEKIMPVQYQRSTDWQVQDETNAEAKERAKHLEDKKDATKGWTDFLKD
ncbi:MAG: efflux RND transporter permease subunit [Bacteroidales bacterium]|nr:efflux RND transporter permease subunit [Bacteroidales bacterium]